MDKGKLGRSHVCKKRDFQVMIGDAKPLCNALAWLQPFIAYMYSYGITFSLGQTKKDGCTKRSVCDGASTLVLRTTWFSQDGHVRESVAHSIGGPSGAACDKMLQHVTHSILKKVSCPHTLSIVNSFVSKLPYDITFMRNLANTMVWKISN